MSYKTFIDELKTIVDVEIYSEGSEFDIELHKYPLNDKNEDYDFIDTQFLKKSNIVIIIVRKDGSIKNISLNKVKNNALEMLSNNIKLLKTTNSIIINECYLQELPEWLKELKKLTSLDVRYNNLQELPVWLKELKSLASLDVRVNNVQELPESIGELKNLASLDVSGNELQELPEWLKELKNLASLDVSSNNVQELPESIGELKNLASLDVRFNALQELPEWLKKLKNLASLDVNSNNVQELPEWLKELKSLASLNVSFNKLQELPESIGELENLASLNVSFNKLHELPESIGELESLESLHVSGNELQELPESIGELESLTSLDVSGNELQELPEWLKELESLESLDVSGNELQELSEWLKELESLESLDVRRNSLKELPESIGELKSLTRLDVSFNKLQELPEWLKELKSLKSLNVRRNSLKELPESIGELKSLKSLDIRNNKITSLDKWVFKKDWLITTDGTFKGLIIDRNIQYPPLQAIEAGKQSVLEWFEARQKGEVSPINEVRVMLLGEGGAGKTSLTNIINGIENDKNLKPTQGIEQNSNVLNTYNNQFEALKVKSATEGKIKVHYWDFGGQDIYYTTHQFFLSSSCIYIIVLNARSNELPDVWLEQIKIYGKSSPAFIVINHVDESKNFDIDMQSYREKYPFIIDRYRTSCTNGYGVDGFMYAFKDYLNNKCSFIKTPYPNKWLKAKNTIEQIEGNTLSKKEFNKICDDNDIKNNDEFSSLLHNLGVIQRLSNNNNVMKSSWLTKSLYKILNCDYDLYSENGLPIDKLDSLLDDIENEFGEKPNDNDIVALLEEYKVCFKDYDHKKLMIPRKIIKAPDYSELICKNKCELKFIYSFFDLGIMHRVIFDLHKKIYNNYVWKNGAVLKINDKNAIAVILADEYKKEVKIDIIVDDALYHPKIINSIVEAFDDVHKEIYSNDVDKPSLYIALKDTDNNKVFIKHQFIGKKIRIDEKDCYIYSDAVNKNLGGIISIRDEDNERGERTVVNNSYEIGGDYIDQSGSKGNVVGKTKDSKIKQVVENSFNETNGLDFEISDLFDKLLEQNLSDDLRDDVEDLKERIEECEGQYTDRQKSRFAQLIGRIKDGISNTISLHKFADGITIVAGLTQLYDFFNNAPKL